MCVIIKREKEGEKKKEREIERRERVSSPTKDMATPKEITRTIEEENRQFVLMQTVVMQKGEVNKV